MDSLKDKFPWAVPLYENEINDIWEKGILTVDANVLLDLYRYHPDTRESIFNSLELFKSDSENRLWLSHQVATEFFRNRNKVIRESRKNYKEVKNFLESLPNELFKYIVQKLNEVECGRSISDDFITNVKNKINEELDVLLREELNSISKIEYQESHILDRIISLFGSNLGDDFKVDEYPMLEQEAKERFENKIPPGYKDNDKEDSRKYGDFFFWKQVSNFSKDINKPIILVTNDKKEDWWEIISGETTGPRVELLKEFWNVTAQKVLIYKTERFLEYSKSKLQRKSKNQNLASKIDSAIRDVKNLSREKTSKQPIVTNVEQQVQESDDNFNSGIISCEIVCPTQYFTVSGHLEPNLIDIPNIEVDLISVPDTGFSYPEAWANTGTLYDFNIHMKSAITFPIGTYRFKYRASVHRQTDNNDFD